MATTKERMVAMLPYNLRDGVNINKYFTSLAELYDDFIANCVEIIKSRDIDQAYGFGLDIIGDIVGIQRKGLSDNDFRELLRTQIASNRSAGDIETLNDFGRTILKNFFIGLIEKEPGTIIMRYTAPLVKKPIEMMKLVAPVGVKIINEIEVYAPVTNLARLGTLSLTKKQTFSR